MPVSKRERMIQDLVLVLYEKHGVPKQLILDNIGVLLSLYDFLTVNRVKSVHYSKVRHRLRFVLNI